MFSGYEKELASKSNCKTEYKCPEGSRGAGLMCITKDQYGQTVTSLKKTITTCGSPDMVKVAPKICRTEMVCPAGSIDKGTYCGRSAYGYIIKTGKVPVQKCD